MLKAGLRLPYKVFHRKEWENLGCQDEGLPAEEPWELNNKCLAFPRVLLGLGSNNEQKQAGKDSAGPIHQETKFQMFRGEITHFHMRVYCGWDSPYRFLVKKRIGIPKKALQRIGTLKQALEKRIGIP